MALQVWLPLDNSFKNLGVMQEGTTASGGAYVNGKVTSKALATGSFTINSSNVNKIMNNTAFSLSVWVKNIKDNPSSGTISTSIFNTGSSPRRFSIFMYPLYSTLHLSSSTNDATTMNLSYTVSDFFPKDVWVHLALTYGNGKVTLYKNGTLIRSDNATFSVTDWNSQSIRMIETNGNRYLNDFRLYNHCLSAKEIKNLAKGLMLHYTLSRSGENILVDTNNGTAHWSWSMSGGSVTKEVVDGNGVKLNCVTAGTSWSIVTFGDATLRNNLEASTNYVCSVKCKPSVDMNLQVSIKDSNSQNAMTNTSNTVTCKANVWTNIVWNLTTKSSFTISSQCIYVNTLPLVSGTWICFKDLKLEKGSKSTPWIPNSTDTLYPQMGLNNNIESDNSGYNNNGTRTNITTWNTDTARYLSSMIFNGSNSYIRCLDPIKSTTSEFTISAWIYLNNITSTMCLWSGRTTVGASVALFIMGTSIRFDDSNQTLVSANLTVNNWIHIVATWKSGGNKIVYVNGVSKSSVSAGTLSKSNNYATIGLSSSADGTSSSEPFNGRISDFRIYATALSADDVKELYNVGASIDKNGNMHCYELVESL